MEKKVIGVYELITGLFGIIIIMANYLLIDREIINSSEVIQQILLGILLYAILAYAGFALLYNFKKAKKFSIFIQFMQIPVLYLPNYIYKFTASGFLALGVKNGEPDYIASLRPIDFTINVNYSSTHMYMIYIVPLIILWRLSKIK